MRSRGISLVARFASPHGSLHWAFGSVALLLVLLILLTPSLENAGLPGGSSVLTAGELRVDRVNSTVELYALSLGQVRFAFITFALNDSPAAPPATLTLPSHWDRWSNFTDRIAASFFVTNQTYFVVNVTMGYEVAPPSATAPAQYLISWGVFALVLSPTGAPTTMTVYPLAPLTGPDTLPVTSPITWSLSTLPQTLALAQGPQGPEVLP